MTQRSLSKYVAPCVIFVFAAVLLVWTYDYQPAMRRMPLLAAWSTIVLSILDALSRHESRLGNKINDLFSWGFSLPDLGWKIAPKLSAEVVAVAWMVAFVAGVIVFGFYIAIPVYVLIATRIQARASWLTAAIAALAVFACVWGMFSGLLEYDIYGGLLFS